MRKVNIFARGAKKLKNEVFKPYTLYKYSKIRAEGAEKIDILGFWAPDPNFPPPLLEDLF